ncbi:CHAP domain-containing protein [Deinococcus peraridilitoris]|uniref:CHAP domain-containing protein n=1 Tax=Deinococcus peraridilitoris TaxID=432329 RepID=UPI00069372A4|nr:CHAP domain-containing protein [Deinococcus peraridilitoris]
MPLFLRLCRDQIALLDVTHSELWGTEVADGELNSERRLVQYKNGGSRRPEIHDLIVFAPHSINQQSGHVAIVIGATDKGIIIAQQNVDAAFTQTFNFSRSIGSTYQINSDYATILGWLRRK